MTMVAACLFKEGAVLISDSRATKSGSTQYEFSDTLQKILPIRKNIALAYAGDVQIAGDVAMEIRTWVIGNNKMMEPEDLVSSLPPVATRLYSKYMHMRKGDSPIYLMIAGIDSSQQINVWVLKSPLFKPTKIKKGFDVIGSGDIVIPYLRDHFDAIDKSADNLKSKADALIVGLESELQKHDIGYTVGGLFQTILLTPEGIRPLRYGFMDLDPISGGDAKSMELVKGTWIQTNEGTGEKINLIEPSKLTTNAFKETRFHEYTIPSQDRKIPKWHINYFITCLKASRDITTTEFHGVVTQIGGFKYPITVPITVSVGFWGTPGENQVELVIENNGKKETIYTRKIETKYLPELFELDIPVNLTIDSPGIAFLEFIINKQILSRKALYFSKSDTIPKTREEKEKFLSEYQLKLTEEHRQFKDPALVERNAEVEYFILCEKCVREGNVLKFLNEMKAVYWNSYPLPLRVYIASAIRMRKGKHSVKIELVNAATRESSVVTNTAIENTSDCLVTPIDGEMIVNIPQPGIYFFNLYVDDKFVTSAILPAELPKAKYSYSLLDEAQKQVESGELIILPRRSMLLSEIETNNKK